MSELDNAPGAKADAKEVKTTKKVAVVGTPVTGAPAVVGDSQKDTNVPQSKEESNTLAPGAKADAKEVKIPTEYLISEKDLEEEPVLKEIGVEVGDTLEDIANKAIFFIKAAAKAKAETAAAIPEPVQPQITKDEVIAYKDGEERSFPRAAWNNLGSNKNGWAVKVNTPSEVKKNNG